MQEHAPDGRERADTSARSASTDPSADGREGCALLEAALAYAARGWPVVPLKPREKIPLVKWTTQHSTDPEVIRGWWARWPNANVGIVTGEISPGRFLSVVDCDVKPGKVDGLAALKAILEHRGEPSFNTWEARSGGGGLHFYHEGPEAIRSTTSELAVGIDTRGGSAGGQGRGYIVAPPSIHPSGRRYEWEVALDTSPVAPGPSPVPAWLAYELGPNEREGRARGPRGAIPSTWAQTAPAEWSSVLEHIGAACRAEPDGWHDMFLAIAGTLASRRVPLEAIPAIVRAISGATGADSKDRASEARTTVERRQLGKPYVGAGTLRAQWPGVAVALEQALQHTKLADLPTRAEAAPILAEWFRTSPNHSVLMASTGSGKSRSALDAAAELAQRGRNAAGAVAPHSGTVLSVPTHKLATQLFKSDHANELRAAGLTIAREFSPPSAVDSDGKPLCHFHVAAKALAAGGLSARYELCEGRGKHPCEHYDNCKAREGAEGHPNPHLVITVHDLLPRTLASAGATSAAIIDEPPVTLEHVTVTREEVTALRENLRLFEARFGGALGDAARALEEAFDTLDPTEGPSSPRSALGERLRPLAGVPGINHKGELVELTSAPVRWEHIARTRGQDAHGVLVGKVAGLAWLLMRLSRAIDRELWTVQHADDELRFVGPRENIEAVVRHPGTARFMDACPDLAALTRLVGCEPAVTRVDVRDGAPVSRHWVRWKGGTRTAMLPRKAGPDFETIARGLRLAFQVAIEDRGARSMALFTYKAVEALIRCARSETEASGRVLLGQCFPKYSPERREVLVVSAREHLAPVLEEWLGGGARTLKLSHYLALRGLDEFMRLDVYVTLADASENLDAVRRSAAHLGIPEDGQRHRFLIARELEQAHGRMRAPGRDAPCRAIHVGPTRPFGVGWEHCDRRDPEQRRKMKFTDDQLVAALEAGGSNHGAARVLKVDRSRVVRRRAGLPGGGAPGGRRENFSTRGWRTPPAPGIPTQSATQNPGETRVSPPPAGGGSFGPILGPATRVGRPRQETLMTPDELCRAVAMLTINRSRSELSALVGCSRKTLQRYEAGERPVSAACAAKIRELLASAA